MPISLEKLPDFVHVSQRFSTQVSRIMKGAEEADKKGGLLKTQWEDIKKDANRLMEESWEIAIKNYYLNIRHDPKPGSEELAEELDEIYWLRYPQAHTLNTTRKKLAKMDLGSSSEAQILKTRATELIDFYEGFADEVNRLKEMIKTQAEIKGEERRRKIESGEIKPKPEAPKAVVDQLEGAVREALSEVSDDISYRIRGMMERVVKQYFDSVDSSVDRARKNYPRTIFKQNDFAQFVCSRLLTEYGPNAGPVGIHGKVDDFDKKLEGMVQSQTRDIVDRFVYKQKNKIPAIIAGLGAPTEVAVAAHSTSPIEGHVRVKMENGAEFNARTQVVYGTSVYGKFYARYPTTFHDVYGPGGEFKGKMLSEDEMLELANVPSNDAPGMSR